MHRLRSLILAAALLASSFLSPAFACAYFHAHTMPSVNCFSLAEAGAGVPVSGTAAQAGAGVYVPGTGTGTDEDLVVSPATLLLPAGPCSFDDATPGNYEDKAYGSIAAEGAERIATEGNFIP